jgi:fucose permease
MATMLLILIYIAFISLGLPDALLGAVWPVMQKEFQVPFGFAGLASMLISGGTILSSIFSSRILRRFGTGLVTAVSVALTALALFGFAAAPSFWWLLLAAVPMGLGAGAVDSGLNSFVAEHYESRHMSWLHSFWGIGALTGPLLLSSLLARGASWRHAYLAIALLQSALVAGLFLALPLWKKVRWRGSAPAAQAEAPHRALFFPLKVKGVKLALAAFFSYCGIEATMGLWGGSFLFRTKGLEPATAAAWVSSFYASITAGRFVTGFITFKVSNQNLIRAGGLVILAGLALMILPLSLPFTLAGFVLTGLGCAAIFPCMLHATPDRFGPRDAAAIMGFQMAVAYIGSTILPPAFGFLASATSLAWMPVLLLAYAAMMIASSEILRRRR